MAGDDRVVFFHSDDDGLEVPLSSYLFTGVLHPIPLSVLALSILAAVRFRHSWRQPRLSSAAPEQTPAHCSNSDQPHRESASQSSVRQTPNATESHAESSQVSEKKKRTKERRKRGKDVTREVMGKHTRSARSRKQDTDARWNDGNFHRDENYASSSSNPMLTPRQGGTFSGGGYIEESVHSSEADLGDDASSVAQDSGDPTDHFSASHISSERQPSSLYYLAPYLPLPPSELTVHALVTMTQMNGPSRGFDRDQVTSFPSENGIQGDLASRSRRSLSPTPSTSGMSATISSVPSSNLSPKTPPPALPVSQSLPSGINKGMFESLQDMTIRESSIWEGDRVPEEDDSSGLVNESEDSRGRMTASVSAPAWDNSLDWTPVHERMRTNLGEDESRSPGLPPSALRPEHPLPSLPHTQDVFFPSLNDPPPTSGTSPTLAENSSVTADVEVSKLKAALEAARHAEEKWRLESLRLAEEFERLKWAWSEDLQKWNQKESDLQHQLYRFMTLHTVQVQQQVAIPSPISGSFPYYVNGQSPGTGKSQNGVAPSPASMQTPLHPVYMAQPTPGMPPLLYNPIGVLPSSPPSAVPGSHSRPNSTTPHANRRASHNSSGTSRSSRPPSRSRAPSPFPSTINTSSGPHPHSSPMSLHLSSPPQRSSPTKHVSLLMSASSLLYQSPSTRSFKGTEGSPGGMGEDSETEDDCIPDHLASAILKRPGSSSIGSTTSSGGSSRVPLAMHSIHAPSMPVPYLGLLQSDLSKTADVSVDGAQYLKEEPALSSHEGDDVRAGETLYMEEPDSSQPLRVDSSEPSSPASLTSHTP